LRSRVAQKWTWTIKSKLTSVLTDSPDALVETTNMDRWLASGSLKRKEITVNEDNESELEASTSQIRQKTTKKRKIKRKYIENYLELGFTYTGTEDEPSPVCVLCYETLANESLKPANLRRHLETKRVQVKASRVF